MAAFRPRWGCIDGWGSIRGGINQMATNDGFQPNRSLIFLSGDAEETEPPDTGTTWDIETIASRILKTSIVAATATAISIAVLTIGNPVELVANVTDWWVDKPALQPEADPSTATVQTIASTQDLPPTTTDTPPRNEIAAAVEPADQSRVEVGQSQASQSQAGQSQAEISQPLTEELFKQFQAWAAEGETRAQTGPAQPMQAPTTKVMQDAPTRVRPVKKHRQVRAVQNARAEIRPQRNHRARVRDEQDARGQVPPVADPRAQDPSMQNAQTPSLLQSLGLRN
jgi:hypothetical protein